jgi:hypothetical protein
MRRLTAGLAGLAMLAGRGPFSGSLSFTAPAAAHAWTLEAFEVGPEDGAITYAVQVPVWVGR